MFKDSTHHYFGHGCSKSSTFRNLVGWVLCFFLVFDDWLVVLTYPNKISVISTNYPKHGWSTINMVSTPQIIIGCIPVISNLWYIYIYTHPILAGSWDVILSKWHQRGISTRRHMVQHHLLSHGDSPPASRVVAGAQVHCGASKGNWFVSEV